MRRCRNSLRTRQVRAVSEIEIFMSQHWSTMVTVYIIGAAVTFVLTFVIFWMLERQSEKVLTTMQSGETCQCYGYYTDVSGVKWLYVAYKNVGGFASSKYLKK